MEGEQYQLLFALPLSYKKWWILQLYCAAIHYYTF